jgi:hypothetical protein
LENVLLKGECRRNREDIPGNMKKRRDRLRQARTSANRRHREKRYSNRRGKKSWQPPSLRILLEGILNIAVRFRKLAPLTSIRMERVRFETESHANPEIQAIEYQRGDFSGLSGSGIICCRKNS